MVSTLNLRQAFGEQQRISSAMKAAIVILFCYIAYEGYAMLCYGGTLSILMEQWSISPEQSGLLASCSLVGMFVGALVLTWLADRIGRKKGVLICMCLFGLGAFAMAFATDAMQIAVMRFLVGLGGGATTSCATALVSEYIPNKSKGFVLGLMGAGFMIGGVAANLLNLALIPAFGWQGPYFFSIAPFVILTLLVVAFVPESPKFYLAKGENAKLASVVNRLMPGADVDEQTAFELESEKKAKVPVGKIFSDHRLISTIGIWVVFFVCQYLTYGINNWLPSLVAESGFDLTSGLVFLLLVNLGGFIGVLLFSKLGDKIGLRKSICWTLGLTVACLVALMFAKGTIAVGCLVALLGAGFFGASQILFSYSTLYYPVDVRALGSGFAGAAGRIGGIVGPSILGVFYAMNLGSMGMYTVLAVPVVLALLCMIFVVKDKYGADV